MKLDLLGVPLTEGLQCNVVLDAVYCILQIFSFSFARTAHGQQHASLGCGRHQCE